MQIPLDVAVLQDRVTLFRDRTAFLQFAMLLVSADHADIGG